MRDYAQLIDAAVRAYQDNSSRSMQSAAGIIGPSDIGFCRQKAVLMTRGVAQSDSPPKWSAAVGTAVGDYVEAAIKAMFPNWLVGSIDKVKVTATLPSGAEISGHPDIVIPEDNAVLDIKTVDGFTWVKREGTSLSHKYQRHLYALGLAQAGILDPAKPILVGNVYFDRSGKQQVSMGLVEDMDHTLTDQIDSWITDVTYAVTHGEDASRDIPAAICERICEYYTACRGGLPINDGGERIEDPELLTAIDTYIEGKNLAKQAEQLKDEAKAHLVGVNGTTDKHEVRWVEVQPTQVNSFTKPGYWRLDIRTRR